MERATAVMNYMISKGIDPARLEAKGYGMSVPVESNKTEEGRAQNRRTEAKILD
jgi:outer membrane protein OmpA-like peptidoglycan-associated protein